MRADIYIRVSTLDQAREGYSLPAQEATLREKAVSLGYEVTDVYCDAGISAKDITHRPALARLMGDVRKDKIDVVMVWALSRLTRSVADLYGTLELFSRHRTSLYSHTESFDTSTPTGRAMVGILGVFAQLEREITAERVRLAMAERAAQGKRTCNEVLGYDLDGPDSLKINEAEAAEVRYIFDSYIAYRNLSAVAALCDALGYRGKRGRVFRAEHIKKILTRPIYIGYNSYNGRLYRGTHEPIIDVKKWRRVQRLLAQNGYKTRGE